LGALVDASQVRRFCLGALGSSWHAFVCHFFYQQASQDVCGLHRSKTSPRHPFHVAYSSWVWHVRYLAPPALRVSAARRSLPFWLLVRETEAVEREHRPVSANSPESPNHTAQLLSLNQPPSANSIIIMNSRLCRVRRALPRAQALQSNART
jgi:hypothetical protein